MNLDALISERALQNGVDYFDRIALNNHIVDQLPRMYDRSVAM